ncbi:hypothetical protein PA598K_05456 [Paenibacillus sp. 598K]|uniref:hypothetical protein n=1 Tax=Paenibacillus sp. 598K TaxID=1117987 RepID=UPI000FF9A286|nr:hypothetical protein [Paenibacillus sp. 598K]GBF76938.1 hypothetical protein PA598K_05456 [Paenibacillus sp. 598K]
MSGYRRLVEKWRRKEAPVRLLLTGCAALLALVAILVGGVLPQWRETSSQLAARDQLEQELAQLHQLAQDRGGDVEAAAADPSARIPQGLDLAGMLEELLGLAESAGLSVGDISQRKTAVSAPQADLAGPLRQAEIELTVQGALPQLLQLLGDIQQTERLLSITEWHYRKLSPGEAQSAGSQAEDGDGAQTSDRGTPQYTMTVLVSGYGSAN